MNEKDNTLLGNVLAIGARLVAEGRIPQDVLDGEPGAFALCLATREAVEVKVLHCGDEIEVGRCPQASAMHWEVDDPWMSRRHFFLAVDAKGAATLRCLGAKNGTFVNDEAVEGGAPLRRGDVIRAGSSSFLVL
ncbi:MAG: FHA domain-containing protein [Kiritimatiellae bacterium]|nr:FHA domain-containing protein [Kiritimatiellia bacterium]